MKTEKNSSNLKKKRKENSIELENSKKKIVEWWNNTKILEWFIKQIFFN